MQRTPVDLEHVKMKLPESGHLPSGLHAESRLPKKEFGLVIWALVVVLGIMLVALVVWYLYLSQQPETVTASSLRPTPEQNREPESRNAQTDVRALGTLSTSRDLNAIEADLESTQLDGLVTELDRIQAELAF